MKEIKEHALLYAVFANIGLNFITSYVFLESNMILYYLFVSNLFIVALFSISKFLVFVKEPNPITYTTLVVLSTIFIFLSIGTPNRFFFIESIIEISILSLATYILLILYFHYFHYKRTNFYFNVKLIPISVILTAVIIFGGVVVSALFDTAETVEVNIKVKEKRIGYSFLPTYKIIADDDKVEELFVTYETFKITEENKNVKLILRKNSLNTKWIKSVEVF